MRGGACAATAPSLSPEELAHNDNAGPIRRGPKHPPLQQRRTTVDRKPRGNPSLSTGFTIHRPSLTPWSLVLGRRRRSRVSAFCCRVLPGAHVGHEYARSCFAPQMRGVLTPTLPPQSSGFSEDICPGRGGQTCPGLPAISAFARRRQAGPEYSLSHTSTINRITYGRCTRSPPVEHTYAFFALLQTHTLMSFSPHSKRLSVAGLSRSGENMSQTRPW